MKKTITCLFFALFFTVTTVTFAQNNQNQSIKNLLVRLDQIGDNHGDINDFFTNEEQLQLRNYLLTKQKNEGLERIVLSNVQNKNVSSTNFIDFLSNNSNYSVLENNSRRTFIIHNQNRIAATTYTDLASFQADVTGTLVSEDFAGGPGGIVVCGTMISSAGDGCFPAGEIVDNFNVTASNATDTVYIDAGAIGNVSILVGANSFTEFTMINFTGPNPVYAVGLDLFNNSDPDTEYRIYDAGGMLMDSYTLNNPAGTENFIGVITDYAIGHIEIQGLNDSGELIGNLLFGGELGGGGGPVPAYCAMNATVEFGTFDPADGSVVTAIGASPVTVNFENAGAIDPNNPTMAYVIDSGGDFYSVDVNTGTYTMLGNIPGDWLAADFNPVDGILYALSSDTNLYSIDIAGISSTLIGSTGLGLAIGLAVDGAGNAYTYDLADDNLYAVDLATGAATLIGNIGFDANFGQGMFWDEFSNTVYMTAFNNGLFDSELRSVDTATGMTSLINQMDVGVLTQYAWSSTPPSGGTPPPPSTCTTYDATGVPFDIDGPNTSTSDCLNAPNLIPATVGDTGIIGTDVFVDNVTMDISHTWSSDLDIFLVSPNGTELELSTDNGGASTDSYNGTMFQDGGADITAASTPFGVGPYAPEGGTFAATFAGEDINGDWNLKICDDAGGDSGTVNAFSITFCLMPPANDDCANAIAVSCGDSVSGSTLAATNSGGDPSNDVYYSFTGTGNAEMVTVSLCGSSFDTILRVMDACGGTEIAMNNDSCGTQSELSFASDGTSTYIIMVEGNGVAEAGDYTLAVSCAPINDDCANALPITCGDTVVGTTIGATIDDTVAPTCDTSVDSPGVWYTFTDASGLPSDVTITMCTGAGGADYDTKLSVYTGDCGAPPLTCVVGNDDTCGLQSEVNFVSDGVSTYYVLVHGYLGDEGNFTLEVSCTPIPPVNDMIVNSIDLDAIGACPDYTDPAVPFPAATFEGGNPIDCNIDGVNGVWYNITVDNDGWLFAEIITPAGISVVNFYEAPNESAVESDLLLVHYVDNQCAPQSDAMIPVVANTTYYLFVANTGGISDVHITCDILGVGENTIEGFNFYPNPTSGDINLRAENTIENVAIFNVLGQKVLDVTVDATTSQLNVSNLTTGTYFMKVTVDGKVGTYKLLKQ